MMRFMVILILTVLSTITGLYFRPSYILIGQLDWFNVLTKGYFVGSIGKFFSQGLIDESFYFVLRFTAGGLVSGIVLSFLLGGPSKKRSSKK